MWVARSSGLVAPIFDAKGAGTTSGGTSSGTVSWNHVIDSKANFVSVIATVGLSGSFPTLTPKCGAVAMNVWGSAFNFNGTSYILGFYLLAPPTGSQTISLAFSSSSSCYWAINSVSYLGVGSVGSLATASGSGTALSQTATAAASGKIIQVFAMNSAPGALSSYNKIQRSYQPGVTSTNNPLLIGESDVDGSNTFTATGSPSAPWGGAVFPIAA